MISLGHNHCIPSLDLFWSRMHPVFHTPPAWRTRPENCSWARTRVPLCKEGVDPPSRAQRHHPVTAREDSALEGRLSTCCSRPRNHRPRRLHHHPAPPTLTHCLVRGGAAGTQSTLKARSAAHEQEGRRHGQLGRCSRKPDLWSKPPPAPQALGRGRDRTEIKKPAQARAPENLQEWAQTQSLLDHRQHRTAYLLRFYYSNSARNNLDGFCFSLYLPEK